MKEKQKAIKYDFKTYKELETNLRIQKAKLRSMQINLNHFIRNSGPKDYESPDYSKIPCNNKNIIPINDFYKELIERQQSVNEQLEYVNKLEEGFIKLQQEIEEASKKFNDLELKVFVLRHIKNNSLLYISKTLNYSYVRIKQISQNINRQIY